MIESNYHQFCLFIFMTLSDCNYFFLVETEYYI